jgi:predicted amidohydrolase
MSKTRIACIQMDCQLANPEANRSRIVEQIHAAAGSSVELAIFPECAVTGYCFESLEEAAEFAEPLNGPSLDAVARACRETGISAVVGFIEKDAGAHYNAAMAVGPGGPIGSYRKVHLPFLGVDRFLTPGNRRFEVLQFPFGRVGMNICYDASFPEAARALKLLGAELVVLPTNWPPGARKTAEYLVNARANENHVNFAAANRVGVERGWRFIGRSKVVDFNGDTLAEAGGENEEMLIAEVDLREANNNRIINKPGAYEIDRIADRRPEFYEVLTEPQKSRSQAG